MIERSPIGVRKILTPECGVQTDLARVFCKLKSYNEKISMRRNARAAK